MRYVRSGKMQHQDKTSVLQSLRSCGLTHEDCRRFFAEYRTNIDLQFINRAKQRYERDGEVEIDSDAEVSIMQTSPEGAYVAAWLWVSKL